jgi:hypothetical protein
MGFPLSWTISGRAIKRDYGQCRHWDRVLTRVNIPNQSLYKA